MEVQDDRRARLSGAQGRSAWDTSTIHRPINEYLSRICVRSSEVTTALNYSFELSESQYLRKGREAWRRNDSEIIVEEVEPQAFLEALAIYSAPYHPLHAGETCCTRACGAQSLLQSAGDGLRTRYSLGSEQLSCDQGTLSKNRRISNDQDILAR
jgi:hypothetical protein